MLCGCVTLAVGTLVILAGLHTQSLAVFLLGGALAGLGFGSSFTGGMRRILAVTQPGERAGVLSAAYLISYLAAAAPSFAAGLLTAPWGLRTVAGAYGALVIVLVLVAIAATRTSKARLDPDTHPATPDEPTLVGDEPSELPVTR